MRIWPSRRTVKRWGIGLAIVLGLLLVANAFMAWRVELRFKAKIAAIHAAGDPASIAELKPEPIPAEENAAAHIDALEPRLDEFSKEYGAFFKTELGQAYEDLAEGAPPTEEQVAAMRAILDKFADLEQKIAAAAACPRYASTADFSLSFQKFMEAYLTRVTRIREAAWFVDWQTQVLIAEGRPEDAVRCGLETLRLARLQEAEPTLVAYLVSVAVRGVSIRDIHSALAAGPVSAELHDQLDRELAKQDDPAKFAKVLRTERALSVSAIHEQGWDMIPAPWSWFVGWPVKRVFIGPLDYYEVLFPVVDRPLPEIHKAFENGGELSTPTGHGVLADLLGPALEAGIQAAQRDTATIRSLRVFNALQVFAEKNGREVRDLTELGLPAEALVDPFSGEPLKAKFTEMGWTVYSVGENETDDGGDFRESRDVGVGPVSETSE